MPTTHAAANTPSPIIDTHQHLWDLGKFRLPWLKGAPGLAHSYLMDDYLKATQGLNVIKSIYMEVDVDPAQHLEEADWVVHVCQRGDSPMVGAVIGGRPASEGFAEYIKRFHGSAYVKGLRQVLHTPETPAGFCLSDRFVNGIRLLGEHGLNYDLCMRPTELHDAAKLIDLCPDTSFILDHCGNADVLDKDRTAWRAAIAEVARRQRVVCKVSGIVASTKGRPWVADDLAPIVNHVYDVFGPDRVLFGGDWPVCTLGATYRQWVQALRTIVHERSAAEQRKLFHDNAIRVYRIV
ncbi:MAG: amidohydrolase family protein [Isosphaeraceae bacterium]|nr:amidohydrolase family protein [Isosphaeraceae bacterium]